MTDDLVSASGLRRQSPGDWIKKLAKLGYATKGVVYIIIGVLALQTALGTGGSTEGTRGAVQEIGNQQFGQILLALTSIGLFGYSLWRIVEAILDPRREGHDAEGVAKRVGYAVSGLAYGALAYWAASVAFGWGTRTGGSDSQQEWTAQLLSEPIGPWLVGLAGMIVIGVGMYHFKSAYTSDFMEEYNASQMGPKERLWARRIGQFGLTARGITFCIIGGFLIQAATQSDPTEARGLGGALQSILNQPLGPWLLALVAAGLVAYGVYCLSRARYSHFQTN